MQPIFTLQYGEYSVANYLKDSLKKCSVFIPMSAQEKGVDLIISYFDGKTTNIQTIQVKTSRTYFAKKKNSTVCGSFWFNVFEIPQNADWIVFAGIVPCLKGNKLESTNIKWETILICMTNSEAKTFMSKLKTKKGTPETKFGFSYDINNSVYLSRGGPWESYDAFRIKNRLLEIKQSLNMV
jgi:hypothetical protein